VIYPRELDMGPREALAHIMAIVKVGKATHDLAHVHRLLREIEIVIQSAIGKGTAQEGQKLRSIQQR
jgi:hypothetical protein